MSFSYVDVDFTNSYTSGDITVTVNVQAGDLVLVWGNCRYGLDLSSVTDEDGNTYTLGTYEYSGSGSNPSVRPAWTIAGSTNATLTITISYLTGTQRKYGYAVVFRPDSGETVSKVLEAGNNAQGTTGTFVTGEGDATGTDMVACAVIQGEGAWTKSNEEMPSGTTTGVVDISQETSHCLLYKFFTSNQTGLEAECDVSESSQDYAAVIIAFNSAVSLDLEQEGFRWRNDNGSESAATWKAAQDVDVTDIGKNENIRLRFLINATGDPDAKQFKLQYKKTADSEWRDMPES